MSLKTYSAAGTAPDADSQSKRDGHSKYWRVGLPARLASSVVC